MSQALTAFEHDYRAVITAGWLEAAELFRLGALADDVFGESRGANRVLAYVLRSIFLDLARRLDGEPVWPELGYFLKTLNAPIEAAIIGLKRPLTEETAARMAIKLLDGRRSFFA